MTAFEIALSQYGIKEFVGSTHNPEVIKYFHEIGFTGIKDDETAWCSAFMNWCQMKAGNPGTKSLAARSWLNWGEKVFAPQIGDVVIFSRGNSSWQGHVGFFVRVNGSQIWTLGGNQGNMVSVEPYDGMKLLGYRRM